jgi:hypothetical protein
MNKPKLEIFDIHLNAWLDCSHKTVDEVRAEAEKCEVMYKVNGELKSWKV